jgi:RNA polymerase sigma-70 factor, ECF subfamily
MDLSAEAPLMMGTRRTVLYCVLPHDLAPELHELLRQHYRDRSDIQVVVEFRTQDRRRRDRRTVAADVLNERRRIRNVEGRRVGERRAMAVPIDAPQLPEAALEYADRIAFVERIEPGTRESEDLDSARLVASAQGGDETAFPSLYMRYFDRLYSYLRLAVKDSHDAEDLAQDVFLQVLGLLPDYEIRTSHPFRVLLFRIARNRSIDHFRRRSRLEIGEPAEIDRIREGTALDDPLGAFDGLSDSELAGFLKRLPAAQRQVLILRYMLDFSSEEIGSVLDITPQAVRSLQHRALTFLRERLTKGRGDTARSTAHMARKRAATPVLSSRRAALGSVGGGRRG